MATVQFKSDKNDVVEAIEKVKAIAKETKLDLGSLLIAMVSAYQSAQNESDLSFLNDLTLEEKEDVSKALQTGVSQVEILKAGFLAQCRKVKSQAGKVEALKASIATEGKDNKNMSTLKGIATVRISNTVEAIMRHNDSNPDRKWFISASKIQNLCNSNMGAIKNYLEANAEMIDMHHKQHDLTIETNDKRSKKFFSITKDVSLEDNE